jgi:hypothetical protein
MSVPALTIQEAAQARLAADSALQALLPGGVYLEPLSHRGTPQAFRNGPGIERGQLLPSAVLTVEPPTMTRPGLGTRRLVLSTYAYRGGGGPYPEDASPYPPSPAIPPQADPLVLACRRAIALLDVNHGAAGLVYGDGSVVRETHARNAVLDGDQPDAEDLNLPARCVRLVLTLPVVTLAGATGG